MNLDDIHKIATTELGLVCKTLPTRRSYWIDVSSGKKVRVLRVSHNAEERPTQIKLAVSSTKVKGIEVLLPLPTTLNNLREALLGELRQIFPNYGTANVRVRDADTEAFLTALIAPVNGQYLRPWMTRSSAPLTARVFTVGFNPRSPYPVSSASSAEYVEALLNSDGNGCSRLHERITARDSRTRRNIDSFVDLLAARGITDVLQTNAVCYATPNVSYLRQDQHRPGRTAGRVVFEQVLHRVQPRVMIVFGRNTVVELNKACAGALRHVKPCTAGQAHLPCQVTFPAFYQNGRPLSIIIIRSLAFPGYNSWHSWAAEHLNLVAEQVEHLLIGTQ